MHYTYTKDLLSLFRFGYNTLDISYITSIPEPDVVKQIDAQRNEEYEQKTNPKPQYRTRIPYAGKETR